MNIQKKTEMKKKKLVLVTHGYPFGESERSFVSSEVDMLKEKYELIVIAICQKGADTALKYHVDGFRALKFQYRDSYSAKYTLKTLTDKVAVKEMSSFFPNIRRMRHVGYFVKRSIALKEVLEKIIKKYGADIIYTFWCTEETYAALLLKKKHPGLKVISRFHNYDLYKERNPFGIQPMHKEVANKADMLVFVSKYGQRYFNREFPGKTKTLVSYLGSKDFGELKTQRERTFVIVSCSNVVAVKRVERIIEALSKVNLSLHWIHIGDGDLFEKTLKYAHEVLDNRKSTFEFLGSVPNDLIPEIYHKNLPDLFVTASSAEGLPVSIMEAFSCGIPVIATDVGGISEIVLDGDNGYLLSQEARPEEIASAIDSFYALSNEARWSMMKSARATYSTLLDANYNAERFVKEIEKIT